jgi:hypothetical protein
MIGLHYTKEEIAGSLFSRLLEVESWQELLVP